MTRFEKYYTQFLEWNKDNAYITDSPAMRKEVRDIFNDSNNNAKEHYVDVRNACLEGLRSIGAIENDTPVHTRKIMHNQIGCPLAMTVYIGSEPAYIVGVGEEYDYAGYEAWAIEQLGEQKSDGTYDCIARFEIDHNDEGRPDYVRVPMVVEPEPRTKEETRDYYRRAFAALIDLCEVTKQDFKNFCFIDRDEDNYVCVDVCDHDTRNTRYEVYFFDGKLDVIHKYNENMKYEKTIFDSIKNHKTA